MRFPRLVIPGCPHHVVQRGNRKSDIFGDDADHLVYLRLMCQACKSHGIAVWDYALMDNHVHYIMVPEREDSLAKTIKEAHGEYSSYLNTKYGLVGHAWQGRFKSFPMDWEYCLNAVRYVERNPVRAGIVRRAEDYLWSSAAARCGLRGDLLITMDCPFLKEIHNWSEWLNVGNCQETDDLIRRHTRAGRPLGRKEFLRRLENQTGRKLLPQKRGPRSQKDLPKGSPPEDNQGLGSHPLFG